MRGEFIDLGGQRLYYYAAGSRGAGDPVILVHGFPTSAHLWLDIVAKLPPGHRIIVVDLLGFGRSDAPVSADYSVRGHARRLLELMDALQVERACLAGHGVGASICETVAAIDTRRVSGLALIGTSSVAGSSGGDSRIGRLATSTLLRLPASVWLPVMRMLVARQFADPERGRRSAELYLKPFAAPGGGKLLRLHLRHLADTSPADEDGGAAGVRTERAPGSKWRFSPEESPSEVAATIARALKRR